MSKQIIWDVPGRYSRRLGERVPDASYASAFDEGKKERNPWDTLCWFGVLALLAGAYLIYRALK